jgi:hypothetical protein
MPYHSTPCGRPPMKQPHGCFGGGCPHGGWPAAVLLPPWISHATWACHFPSFSPSPQLDGDKRLVRSPVLNLETSSEFDSAGKGVEEPLDLTTHSSHSTTNSSHSTAHCSYSTTHSTSSDSHINVLNSIFSDSDSPIKMQVISGSGGV